MRKYILALDQGTTSSRAIIYDASQHVLGTAQKEFSQIFPQPGWVEHNAMEIYAGIASVIAEALAISGISVDELAAVGITNQRETTVVWDKDTGLPICNAIVWQCRRTAEDCETIKKDAALCDCIRKNTGLLVDAYFSATKIRWILDHVPGARKLAEEGRLLFGTVDTWLVWKLTGGKSHVTDYTNASRTMLFNIRTLQWDEGICKALDIPMSMLPQVLPSCANFGNAEIQGHTVPICGIAGDQQASLFGQVCFDRGEAKNTYGTGCFLLMNTGTDYIESRNGLITTVAAAAGSEVHYALEGSVFVGGAVIQWLRDELGLIRDAADSEYYANKVSDTGGVYLVPAFTGLGAPYWDMYARGTMIGITRGTRREHIVRAALESIAYQSADLLNAMEKDMGAPISELRTDGGASRNGFLMQFQADVLNRRVCRSTVTETTALGAAYLAGLYAGLWRSLDEIRAAWASDRVFAPTMSDADREKRMAAWHDAVSRSLGQAK